MGHPSFVSQARSPVIECARLAVTQAQALPAGVAGPAAVDGKSVAVDESALLRIGEEEDRAGDVVRSGKAAIGMTPMMSSSV